MSEQDSATIGPAEVVAAMRELMESIVSQRLAPLEQRIAELERQVGSGVRDERVEETAPNT